MTRVLMSLSLALACTVTSWGQGQFFPWANGRQPVRNTIRRVVPNNFRANNYSYNNWSPSYSNQTVDSWAQGTQGYTEGQSQQFAEGQQFVDQSSQTAAQASQPADQAMQQKPASQPTSSYSPSPESQNWSQQQQPEVQPQQTEQQYAQPQQFEQSQSFQSPTYYSPTYSVPAQRSYSPQTWGQRARNFRPVRSFFGR